MLFEQARLTPQGRLETIEHLFESVARREGDAPAPGVVPIEALEAYGAFETPIRHVLEAACLRATTREQKSALRRIEHSLNALPEALMTTLRAEPGENWLDFYRRLIGLHNLITETATEADPEEYAAMLQRMVALADAVSRHSRVSLHAASAFTLLLMQVELERQKPKKKKPRRAKRRKKPTAKKKKSSPPKE